MGLNFPLTWSAQFTRTDDVRQQQAIERAQCIMETFDGVKVRTIAERQTVAREPCMSQQPSQAVEGVLANPRGLPRVHTGSRKDQSYRHTLPGGVVKNTILDV